VDFQVGEKVIYPNHGIGVVESIQTAVGNVGVYVLHILSNDSKVWVPRENAVGVGLRPVIASRDVRKIFNLLGDGNIEQHPNWKGRFKENSDKMRSGSIYEVASVLKGLASLSRKKSLSFREKRMLDRARFLIVSEIAEVEGKPVAWAEEKVERAVNKTLSSESNPVAKKPVQKPVAPRRRALEL
jgi:CarD family transcriptional regulator